MDQFKMDLMLLEVKRLEQEVKSHTLHIARYTLRMDPNPEALLRQQRKTAVLNRRIVLLYNQLLPYVPDGYMHFPSSLSPELSKTVEILALPQVASPSN